MMRFFVLLCIAFVLHNSEALHQGSKEYEDMLYWKKSGQESLQKRLLYRNNEKRAKNVIIFIGDGMGINSVTAGRIYTGQKKGLSGEEYKLIFEQFPNTGFSKTYNVDRQVPDSAGTATALFSGVKCRFRVIGFDGKAPYNHCDNDINEKSKLKSVADLAQENGMDTGFVTTTRVTHATPAGLYAHVNNRNWECDSKVPKEFKGCAKDIAAQLIEDAPGNNFNVIMGGGAENLGMSIPDSNSTGCKRTDRRNLSDIWLKNNPKGKLVTNMQELMSVDIGNTSKIMGIFAPSHLPYHDEKTEDIPSLANMTTQAIRLLRKNKNGFLLMVESGKIDIAHHNNYARMALREVAELEEAVKAAMRQVKVEDTLIIVTADHSHSMTINGYPERGNDILGYSQNPYQDAQVYETISYANGPSYFYHRLNDSTNVNETWRNVAKDNNRNNTRYMNMAPMYLDDETHGGEDVGVYAIGPYSHLLRGTFEQNYIAHVVAYAACFKEWRSHCDSAYNRYFYELMNSGACIQHSYLLLTIFLATLLLVRNR